MIPLVDYRGILDPTAVVERIQASILAYTPLASEVDDFINLMGGGTRWTIFNDPPSVFTPGWYIWTQEDVVYLHMGGTDIAESWGGHLAIDVGGAFLGYNGHDKRFSFHEFWLKNAQDVSQFLLTFFRRFQTGRYKHLSLSGHSYGGAVVQIAGWLFKQERPDVFVECLAFGSPKPILQPNNGVRLDGAHCVQIHGDPIGFVPFTVGSAIWASPERGGAFFQGEPRIKWQQLGRTYRMDSDDYVELPRTDWHWGAPAINSSISNHYGAVYRNKALMMRRAILGLDEVDAFERMILGQPNPPAPIDPLGPPAARVRINVAGWNEEYFDSLDGSSPLTQNAIDDTITVSAISSITPIGFRSNIVPLNLANPIYKFTFSISDSIFGNSWSTYLRCPGVLSADQLAARANSLMASLASILSNGGATQPTAPSAGTAMIMAWRSTQVGQRQNTLLKTGPFLGVYAPPVWAVQDGSQQFNSGINVRMTSQYEAPASAPFVARTVKTTTNMWMPSPPDSVVSKDRYVPAGNSATGAYTGSYGGLLFDFLTKLASPIPGGFRWGHMGRDPNIPQVNLINCRQLIAPQVAPLVAGWAFDCTADSGWNARDVIQIMTANARYWNGQYRVTSVLHVAPFTVCVAGGPNFQTAPFTSALGLQLRTAAGVLNEVFYDYTFTASATAEVARPSVRKPARPFSLVSFRRKPGKQKTSR